MTDLAWVIEHARFEGLDLATALRIARTAPSYLSGPSAGQLTALRDLDRSMAAIAAQRRH